MAELLYFTPARRKITTAHIYTDTGARSVRERTHDNGEISLIIEAESIKQAAAALNDYIAKQEAKV